MCDCITIQEERSNTLMNNQVPNAGILVKLPTLSFKGRSVIPIELTVSSQNNTNITKSYIMPQYCAFCGEKI